MTIYFGNHLHPPGISREVFNFYSTILFLWVLHQKFITKNYELADVNFRQFDNRQQEPLIVHKNGNDFFMLLTLSTTLQISARIPPFRTANIARRDYRVLTGLDQLFGIFFHLIRDIFLIETFNEVCFHTMHSSNQVHVIYIGDLCMK
ncbi:hypothetical protein ATY38_01195 [Nitrosomonas ureae]|nr:hypothetical protein ATY38_01195 [Nitrosomonas ureae]